MNAVITTLISDALEKGLLTIHHETQSVFTLKVHVLGMAFTLTTIRIAMEASHEPR